jgi:hypothetical protein
MKAEIWARDPTRSRTIYMDVSVDLLLGIIWADIARFGRYEQTHNCGCLVRFVKMVGMEVHEFMRSFHPQVVDMLQNTPYMLSKTR